MLVIAWRDRPRMPLVNQFDQGGQYGIPNDSPLLCRGSRGISMNANLCPPSPTIVEAYVGRRAVGTQSTMPPTSIKCNRRPGREGSSLPTPCLLVRQVN